jgi:ribosome-binding factor A
MPPSNNRNEKMQEVIRMAAAEFLVREANPQSLITVTRVLLSNDGKSAQIFITVFPDSAEAAALAFANRHRSGFGEFFKKQRRGAFPPKVEFYIDMGEKNRQRMDELSN